MGLSLSDPSINLLLNNISLLSILQVKRADEGFNRLLNKCMPLGGTQR